MSATIDVLDPAKPKRILIVASNPAVSGQTGWPIGFWWAELTHAYVEFAERGYQMDIASPDGGTLQADGWSDPRDKSGYSAEDLISLGFIHSPDHAALVEKTMAVSDAVTDAYDALYVVGGQGPMYTFYDDDRMHELAARFYQAGKITAIVCHATCMLLRTRLASGDLLITGKTWTGFANSEEDYADAFVGQKFQPFRIEDQARKLAGTNFIVAGLFRPHAVRDGLLITGQQQYSGAAAARLVIQALGQ
jgi:putative intracellular protease/amidase